MYREKITEIIPRPPFPCDLAIRLRHRLVVRAELFSNFVFSLFPTPCARCPKTELFVVARQRRRSRICPLRLRVRACVVFARARVYRVSAVRCLCECVCPSGVCVCVWLARARVSVCAPVCCVSVTCVCERVYTVQLTLRNYRPSRRDSTNAHKTASCDTVVWTVNSILTTCMISYYT